MITFPICVGLRRVQNIELSMIELGQLQKFWDKLVVLLYKQRGLDNSGDLHRGHIEYNLELSQQKATDYLFNNLSDEGCSKF
jgi:hypothetical protein